MSVKNLWDVSSIDDIAAPEIFMENAKMGIARIQIEVLKIKELQRTNEKLDKLIGLLSTLNAKPAKGKTIGTHEGGQE